jgi:hypothetical protein
MPLSLGLPVVYSPSLPLVLSLVLPLPLVLPPVLSRVVLLSLGLPLVLPLALPLELPLSLTRPLLVVPVPPVKWSPLLVAIRPRCPWTNPPRDRQGGSGPPVAQTAGVPWGEGHSPLRSGRRHPIPGRGTPAAGGARRGPPTG